MRYSIHTIEDTSESYECPNDAEEHERRVRFLQRAQGYTVIVDVDTTDNPRLDDMRFTVLSKAKKRSTAKT